MSPRCALLGSCRAWSKGQRGEVRWEGVSGGEGGGGRRSGALVGPGALCLLGLLDGVEVPQGLPWGAGGRWSVASSSPSVGEGVECAGSWPFVAASSRG